ncbi:STN domain-containing protein [Chryseolinea sp. T2]|uniref:STN domain-containing protein n=1 Tax=Chryseolinea sp. T2 TaxID=3129255 RepID=UPI0030780216
MVLWVAGISLQAQSVGARKVSCAFTSTRLDEVIRHLSVEAGVSFIYSSNKTDLNRAVTLSIDNRSLEETLALIGSQLGIEFKIQGRYVMIKQLQIEARTSRNAVGRVPMGARKLSSDLSYYAPSKQQSSSNRLQIPAFAERMDPTFIPALTTTQLNTIPTTELRKVSMNHYRPGLFVSVGPLLNDYSSGIEMQAGIQRAYFVFTPSWLSNGRFHVGYGIGTSIDLGHNLSFNPIYSFNTSRHSTTSSWRNNQGINELEMKEKTVHHQVKLMIQYAVTPSFMVKLGPTINQSTTDYDTYRTTTFVQRRSIIVDDGNGGGYGNVVVVNQVDASNKSAALLSTQRVRDAWLGWEASIALKINFLEKK